MAVLWDPSYTGYWSTGLRPIDDPWNDAMIEEGNVSETFATQRILDAGTRDPVSSPGSLDSPQARTLPFSSNVSETAERSYWSIEDFNDGTRGDSLSLLCCLAAETCVVSNLSWFLVTFFLETNLGLTGPIAVTAHLSTLVSDVGLSRCVQSCCITLAKKAKPQFIGEDNRRSSMAAGCLNRRLYNVSPNHSRTWGCRLRHPPLLSPSLLIAGSDASTH